MGLSPVLEEERVEEGSRAYVPANGAYIRPVSLWGGADPPEVIAVPWEGSSCLWWGAYH